jgi:hypothetical protein
MNKFEKQLDEVFDKLKKTGRISRNWCLSRGITRLAALINKLKQNKYKFSANYTANKSDYVYVLKK